MSARLEEAFTVQRAEEATKRFLGKFIGPSTRVIGKCATRTSSIATTWLRSASHEVSLEASWLSN